jgi:hypothetical protein
VKNTKTKSVSKLVAENIHWKREKNGPLSIKIPPTKDSFAGAGKEFVDFFADLNLLDSNQLEISLLTKCYGKSDIEPENS